MTTDEKVQMRLEASGHDLQTDDGARLYQQQLDQELEQQKRQAAPTRKVERMRGIMI